MRFALLVVLVLILISTSLAAQAEGVRQQRPNFVFGELGTVSAGYQYQSEGGFFVRPTMTMFYRGEGFIVLPGIALGGTF